MTPTLLALHVTVGGSASMNKACSNPLHLKLPSCMSYSGTCVPQQWQADPLQWSVGSYYVCTVHQASATLAYSGVASVKYCALCGERLTYQCKLLCSSGPVAGPADSLNSGHTLEVSNAAEGSDQEGESSHSTSSSKQLQPKLLDIVTSQRDRFRAR